MEISLNVAAVVVAALSSLIVGGIISLVRLGTTVAQLHERVSQMEKQHLERIQQVRDELNKINRLYEHIVTRLDSLAQSTHRQTLR